MWAAIMGRLRRRVSRGAVVVAASLVVCVLVWLLVVPLPPITHAPLPAPMPTPAPMPPRLVVLQCEFLPDFTQIAGQQGLVLDGVEAAWNDPTLCVFTVRRK